MSNVFHHLGHVNRLRYFADMFEEYDRLYATFLQITTAAQAGPQAHWRELESRIGFLRVRIAALCEETQLVLIKQAEERRQRKGARDVAFAGSSSIGRDRQMAERARATRRA